MLLGFLVLKFVQVFLGMGPYLFSCSSAYEVSELDPVIAKFLITYKSIRVYNFTFHKYAVFFLSPSSFLEGQVSSMRGAVTLSRIMQMVMSVLKADFIEVNTLI